MRLSLHLIISPGTQSPGNTRNKRSLATSGINFILQAQEGVELSHGRSKSDHDKLFF